MRLANDKPSSGGFYPPSATPNWQIINADVRLGLRSLPAASIHCAITSVPYWGLRNYGTDPQVWGGDPSCSHEWVSERYYREGGNAGSSALAFSEPGEANAQRLKDARWHDDTRCVRCGAWRGELGLEPSIAEYVSHMVEVFREVRRVLRPDATLWLNVGDSYMGSGRGPQGQGGSLLQSYWSDDEHREGLPMRGQCSDGLKPKDLCMVPFRLAIALQMDGWWVRSPIIWEKPNPMPEAVLDRPTTSHEYVFLCSKSARYFYDAEAVKEPVAETAHSRGAGLNPKAMSTPLDEAGPRSKQNASFAGACNELVTSRNLRTVWRIATESYPGSHFATFPTELVKPCILAGTSERGCCPTCGAPWWRVVERIKHGERGKAHVAMGALKGTGNHGTMGVDGAGMRYDSDYQLETKTLGWEPSCKCPTHEPIPSTVLDPFSGTATVGAVALRLGRSYRGVEIKPEYVQMGRNRIIGDCPMLNTSAEVQA